VVVPLAENITLDGGANPGFCGFKMLRMNPENFA
jgi:hypothetical protein